MIRNYLKIAFRNMLKHKFTFFINLFGLTVGLACCLLILSYILHEVSYDKFQPQAERTYRFSRSFNNAEGVQSLHLGAIAPPFGPLLQHEFPEIQKMTRILSNGNTSFVYEDKRFYENRVFFADENLTDIFKVDVVKGNVKKALEAPFSIMITEEIAKKYFGNEDPMDKLVKLDNIMPVKVAGIFKPFPSNTHIHPDVLISFNTLNDTVVYGENNLKTNWGNNSFMTYAVLAPGTDAKKLEARMPAFIDKYWHFPGEPPGFVGSKFTKLFLTPMTDIHLRSHLDYEVEPNGDIKRVYIFSIIALFILLIACINYMNLSTARSVLRAKEIGIRKAVGAEKKEIITQFLSESVLITWLSIILAFGLTALLLPWLSKLSGVALSLDVLFNVPVLLGLVLAPFIVGILSGLYPALFMSSFQPVKVLKGLFKIKGNLSLRKALVVTQFAVSIILIISTAVVFLQMQFMQNKSLGLSKDQVITMTGANFNGKFESFRNELLQVPGVKNITRSSRVPTIRLLDAMGLGIPEKDTVMPSNVNLKYLAIDYNFLPSYNIQLAAGRNYSADFVTDSSAYIVNETASKAMGYKTPDEAIDKEIVYGGTKGKIIGVAKDFHFESLHQEIPSLILLVRANFLGSISVKLSGNNIQTTLAGIESTWKKFLPETPFASSFLDERFSRVYEAEQKQRTLYTTFACIAIFIACLGLFGLSAFTISQRIKEIGIRKVLGANVGMIVTLLSKDFLKLVVIAALIAFPVAWYAMNKWLQDFAYRIDIPWLTFIFAGVIAALIAFATISFQAIKAARANPVKSLRTE